MWGTPNRISRWLLDATIPRRCWTQSADPILVVVPMVSYRQDPYYGILGDLSFEMTSIQADLAPDNTLTSHPNAYCLAKPGHVYEVYLLEGGSADLNVASGIYSVQWYNPRLIADYDRIATFILTQTVALSSLSLAAVWTTLSVGRIKLKILLYAVFTIVVSFFVGYYGSATFEYAFALIHTFAVFLAAIVIVENYAPKFIWDSTKETFVGPVQLAYRGQPCFRIDLERSTRLIAIDGSNLENEAP